jgi:hypothetical protein
VRHNATRGRYELDTPHGLAIAVYHQQGDRLVFTHTEVLSEDEGRGIGSELVRGALDDARRRGFKIVPACSFVVDFVRRHPEYSDSA